MADILNKLNSANYVTVKVTDNAIVNGNNLLAAYALAKTVTPNGSSLSTSNRLAVVLPPAIYNLGTQSLILDTQYVDIIGSTSDRSKHYITSNVGAANRGTVQQTANDVKLHNLKIENSNLVYIKANNSTDPSAYFPNTNLNLTYIENVLFTSVNINQIFPMRVGIEYSGTFKDCTGGDFSFGGYGGTASGTFKDCIGGDYSFSGASGTASGTFKDCIGGDYSFSGDAGNASGTFTDCTGGFASFGGNGGTASGTFTNCTGGDVSFGGLFATASGDFIGCTGGYYSFGGYGGTASGTFTDCTAGDESFGGGVSFSGTASGTFTNCTGGIDSFNL
jgi:hypothetical protein